MAKRETPWLLYAADANELTDNSLYEHAYASVSSKRRAKVDAFRFDSGKRLSLCAALLLRKALRESGWSGGLPEIAFGEGGKPYVAHAPHVHFNLSHSGCFALCALSPVEVGCDIERQAQADVKLAQRFFAPGEYRHIALQGEKSKQDELFFRYWTLKESFMKATGLGMALPLDAFRIDYREGVPHVSHEVDECVYHLREYTDIKGYSCAVCTKDAAFEAPLTMVRLESCLR